MYEKHNKEVMKIHRPVDALPIFCLKCVRKLFVTKRHFQKKSSFNLATCGILERTQI